MWLIALVFRSNSIGFFSQDGSLNHHVRLSCVLMSVCIVEARWGVQLSSSESCQGNYLTCHSHSPCLQSSFWLGFVWIKWIHSWRWWDGNTSDTGCNSSLRSSQVSSILPSESVDCDKSNGIVGMADGWVEAGEQVNAGNRWGQHLHCTQVSLAGLLSSRVTFPLSVPSGPVFREPGVERIVDLQTICWQSEKLYVLGGRVFSHCSKRRQYVGVFLELISRLVLIETHHNMLARNRVCLNLNPNGPIVI